MSSKQSDALERVMDLVRFLRTHCPWDAAQTPRSLVPYLLEEAHESAEAIALGDDDALRAELGDLLLNIAFQLVLGEERDAFDADAVADTVIDKMQRRHPHLFGLGEQEDWEALKARERDDDASLLHGVAPGLDPLSRAHRIQDRVAAVGFDWEDAAGAFQKVAEELEEVREQLQLQRRQQGRAPATKEPEPDAGATPNAAAAPNAEAAAEAAAEAEPDAAADAEAESDAEVREEPSATTSPTSPTSPGSPTSHAAGGDPPTPPTPTSPRTEFEAEAEAALEEELGDLLFAVVNLARLAGSHALTALHGANAKFTRRFEGLERLAAERGIELGHSDLDTLESLWQEVKTSERA